VADEFEVINPKIVAKLRRFLELRDAKDETEAAAKAAKKAHDDAELELHQILSEGVDGTLKVPLGDPYGTVSFLPQVTKTANILNDRTLEAYLEERQMMDEYSKPQLVKGRLNEMVRDFEERGEPMPPGLEMYKKRYVRVTRPKGAKKKSGGALDI
jgi:hypothetical protein